MKEEIHSLTQQCIWPLDHIVACDDVGDNRDRMTGDSQPVSISMVLQRLFGLLAFSALRLCGDVKDGERGHWGEGCGQRVGRCVR